MVPPTTRALLPALCIALAIAVLVPVPALAQDTREEPQRDAADSSVPHDVAGRHVAFTAHPDRAALTHYTVDRHAIFDVVDIEPDLPIRTQPLPDHPGWLVVSRGWRMAIGDVPEGAARFAAREDARGLITLDPVDGSAIRELDRHALTIETPDGIIVHVRAPDGYDVQDGKVAIRNEAAWRLAEPRPDTPPAVRDRLTDAFSNGRLGAEVSIERPGQDADVATYDNLTVSTSAGEGTLRAVVQARGVAGRTLVFHLDRSVIAGTDLRVTLDGSELANADGLLDVLDPDDDGLNAEWWAVRTDRGVIVFVSVPHFSDRVIEVQWLEAVPAEARPILGAVGALAVVSIATVLLFRGRRNDL